MSLPENHGPFKGAKSRALTLKEQGGKQTVSAKPTDQSVKNMPMNDLAEHEFMQQSGECII